MTARVLDGKALAAQLREQVAVRVRRLQAATGTAPGLAVVVSGDDPAAAIYVRNKERACEEAGIHSQVVRLPAAASQAEALAQVKRLNDSDLVHGILVQWPVPGGLDFEALIAAIDPAKDVDGLHPVNMGRLLGGEPGMVACTPRGIMALLEAAAVELTGSEAVVVGRSKLVGKPCAQLLLARHATVTICHSRTRELGQVTRRADVLVAAAGVPQLIGGAMIRPGATVIDVGINRTNDGLVGDVDFAAAREVAGAITPVPGGVGPMTVAMLLQNTLETAARQLDVTAVLAPAGGSARDLSG